MKKTLAVISAILAFTVLFSSCAAKDGKDGEKTTASTSAVNRTDADITDKDDVKSTEPSSTEKSTEKSESTTKLQLNFKENYAAKGKKIASAFNYKAVLEDVSEIDLYQKRPDFSKFTKKTVVDPDSSTRIDRYYKGGTLVYEVYNDFGERGYFHYTKTKSGKPLQVMYWDDIDCKKLEEITMKGDGFSLIFRQLNKAKPCGADEIYITVENKRANDLPDTANFEINKDTVTITDAKLYTGSDYISYYANKDASGKLAEGQTTMFSVCKSEISTDAVKKIQSETTPVILQTLVGNHKLSYKQNGANKNWFITCDLYIVFNTKEDADSFVGKNGLSSNPSVSVENENCTGDSWYVRYKDVTLGIADGFKAGSKSFSEFALDEFNDLTFANITFNSNCQVTNLNYDNSVLSYY